MNVMLLTTPIRPIPTSFPPIGSLSIINYLRKHGVESEFYHIDALRPSYEEAIRHIIEARPDVLGVSSVVSTAYAYTKRLVMDVKAALPDTLVIVGGSLAASAEILLRRAQVDLCALGEGEKVMLNVVERAKTTRNPADFADISGLVLLDENGQLVNTGYEDQLKRDEIYDFRWEDLENACDISTYVYPAFNEGKPDFWFERDSRTYEPHRRDKYVTGLPGAKGCVAKCTFCHRWDKGIRYIPMDLLRQRVQFLVEHYNVGFLQILDENFGTDRKWLAEFCEVMRRFDILWQVGGMRVNCIDPERLHMMKDAGCVAVIFGMESGSEKILRVMDKKVKLQDNYNAMQWTIEAEQSTTVQLVIGMPGETPATIRETTRFAMFANTLAEWQRPWDLSINFAQALPGTPLYEYGRRVGLIDPTMDGEEGYLLRISDKDSSDEDNTLNFTAYPYFIHRSWRQYIQLKTARAYVSKFGKAKYAELLLADTRYFKRKTSEETGYYNKPKRDVERTLVTDTINDERQVEELEAAALPSFWSLLRGRRIGLLFICYPEICGRFTWGLPMLWFLRSLLKRGVFTTFDELFRWVFGGLSKGELDPDHSLRKVVFNEMGPVPSDAEAMEPLRRGR